MDENTIRLYLHSKLQEAYPGVKLYYQPPGDMILTRPCVIYEYKEPRPVFANSNPYTIGLLYQVTLLSNIPNEFIDRNAIYSIKGIMVLSSNHYVSEDISHTIFTVSVNSI